MPAIYPSRSDYETLIRRLDVFAADSAVKTGRVLMRKDGLFPQAFSGGRAVVFPVLIKDRKYAIKCWIQSLGALEERYKAISRLIQGSKPPYLIESVYREKELLFNGTRYPVLQMQWSESRTLKEWISDHINNSARLSALAQHFLEVVADMHRNSMSHGDLQHENILVSEDSMLTLVDYDSIYLKGLDHLDDEIKGLPGFQHQSRSSLAKANPKSDFLSEYVIYTTLVALSKDPELWNEAKDHNRLLFSQDDLSSPISSNLFQKLKAIDGLSDLIDAFQKQCMCLELNDISPIESFISLPKSPNPPRIEVKANKFATDTTIESVPGSSRDLRNAQIWAGSQNSTSEWIFGEKNKGSQSKISAGSENDTTSGNGNKSESSPNNPKKKTSNKSAFQNSPPYHIDGFTTDTERRTSKEDQSLLTPRHYIQGCFRGHHSNKVGLSYVSIERRGIKLGFDDNGDKNEVLVLKDNLVGLRSLGSKLELVTSNLYGGTDVFTISAPDSQSNDKIYNLLHNMEPLCNEVPSHSDNSVDTSNLDSWQAYQSRAKISIFRKFSYSSVDDIAFWTEKGHDQVRSAAEKIKAKPPFSLAEADRIAELLLGDPSIRRAFMKKKSSNRSHVYASTEQSLGNKFDSIKSTTLTQKIAKKDSDSPLIGDRGLANSSSQQSSVSAGGVSKGDCFVATAIYETECHPDLDILRDYRDRVLLSSRLGRQFVSIYYRVGPLIAKAITRAKLSSKLRPIISNIVKHLSAGTL